jgi:uncharacterized protein YmfQ (DUF2313 family)
MGIDEVHYDEKKVSETAKKLMATLQLKVSDSIKFHLEKAYEIGYNDAIEEIKKVIIIPLKAL